MRVATLVGTGLVLGWLALPATAQRADKPTDPVEAFRRALSEPVPLDFAGIEQRRRNLREKMDALKTVAQMSNALSMPHGWREDFDQDLRLEIAERLYARLRTMLASKDTEEQLAALTLIGALGNVRGAAVLPTRFDEQAAVIGELLRGPLFGDRLGALYLSTGVWVVHNRGGLSRPLAPDVVKLLESGPLEVRLAAARALGEANAAPAVATPALQKVISSKVPAELRRAAARALVNLINSATERYVNRMASSGISVAPPIETAAARAHQDFLRKDLVDLIPVVVDAARPGMDDPDDQVELASTEAVTIAASATGALVTEVLQRRSEGGRRLLEFVDRETVLQERFEVLPATQALARLAEKPKNGGVSAMVNVLNDEDAPVRLQACTALQEMSYTRWKLIQRAASIPPPNQQTALPEDEDPLKPALLATLPALDRQLNDPDKAIRLMAVKAIEWLMQDAAPATPTLIRGLRDSDRFVRWQSARILGDVKPAADAVPGLAALLFDPDLDLRLVAAETLAEYGPAAAAALPALQTTVNRGDPEIRIAAIEAIVSQGKQAVSSVPALIKALEADDPRVISSAALALNSFGAAARPAEPALRKLLDHPDPVVRRSISETLLDLKSER